MHRRIFVNFGTKWCEMSDRNVKYILMNLVWKQITFDFNGAKRCHFCHLYAQWVICCRWMKLFILSIWVNNRLLWNKYRFFRPIKYCMCSALDIGKNAVIHGRRYAWRFFERKWKAKKNLKWNSFDWTTPSRKTRWTRMLMILFVIAMNQCKWPFPLERYRQWVDETSNCHAFGFMAATKNEKKIQTKQLPP